MKKRILMALFGLLAVLSLRAQTGDAQIRAQINKVAQRMQSMQCDFVQTKQLKLLNDKMVSSGKMYYQQSNRLRWEYSKPYNYVFIINGNQVTIKNDKRKDVINVNQNKMFKEIARIMMNSVVGKCVNDSKDFKVFLTATSTEWIATLLPLKKQMKSMFQKILLHFNRKQAMVSQVEMVEKNGDKTIIVLKNVQVNKKISPNIFSVH